MEGSPQTLNVLIATPERVIFEGKAQSIVLPGEKGVFEVLPYHKAILSRLLSGKVILDGRVMQIRRGVMKASMNQVTIIVEETAA
jgi:F-type H+-transporting ATPase subunit epsilon